MAVDPGVNDDHEEQTGSAEDDQALPVRWWLRRPALGILLSMLLGMAAFLVTASIGTPGSDPGTTVTNLVVLPIALLLPVIALAAALVAWSAFGQTRGQQRAFLLLPLAAALLLNSSAIAMFARWVLRVFTA